MNAGTIRLVTIILSIFSCYTSLSQFKPSSLAALDKVTAEETYHFVGNINSSQGKLTKRGAKTHRLDSVFYWTREDTSLDFKENGYLKFEYSDSTELSLSYQYLDSGSFKPAFFALYNLDPELYCIKEYYFSLNWDGSQNQVENRIATHYNKYFYNSDDLLWKIEFAFEFDLGLDNPSLQYIYDYDSKGRLQTWTLYDKEAAQDTFTRFRSVTYQYDPFDNLASIVRNTDTPSAGWVAEDSIQYTYNSQSLLLKIDEFAPQTETTWWKNLSHDYIYQNSDLVSEVTIQGFSRDGIKDEWYINEDYNYSSNDDLSSLRALLFIGNDFQPAYYYRNQHDNTISKEDIKYPFELFEDVNKWNSMIKSNESGRDVDQIYIADQISNSKVEYYYSNLDPSNSIEIQRNSLINIFPNPTRNFINIQSQENQFKLEFSLFDINGIKIWNQLVTDDSSIDVSSLRSGLYIYRFTGKESLQSGKLIIE